MKRKLLPALFIVGALFFTACQEDAAMEEIVDNIELTDSMDPDDDDDDDGNPGKN